MLGGNVGLTGDRSDAWHDGLLSRLETIDGSVLHVAHRVNSSHAHAGGSPRRRAPRPRARRGASAVRSPQARSASRHGAERPNPEGRVAGGPAESGAMALPA